MVLYPFQSYKFNDVPGSIGALGCGHSPSKQCFSIYRKPCAVLLPWIPQESLVTHWHLLSGASNDDRWHWPSEGGTGMGLLFTVSPACRPNDFRRNEAFASFPSLPPNPSGQSMSDCTLRCQVLRFLLCLISGAGHQLPWPLLPHPSLCCCGLWIPVLAPSQYVTPWACPVFSGAFGSSKNFLTSNVGLFSVKLFLHTVTSSVL